MADAFIGEVRVFPYSFNPAGWILCDGREITIAEYTALYAIIGTYYGTTKTPRATFFVPNLTGKAAIGTGSSSAVGSVIPGMELGAETQTLTINHLASHTHQLQTMIPSSADDYASAPTAETSWAGRLFHVGEESRTYYRAYNPKQTESLDTYPEDGYTMGSLNVTGADSSEDTTISLMQPYCAMGFYICYEGEFPQRT